MSDIRVVGLNNLDKVAGILYSCTGKAFNWLAVVQSKFNLKVSCFNSRR